MCPVGISESDKQRLMIRVFEEQLKDFSQEYHSEISLLVMSKNMREGVFNSPGGRAFERHATTPNQNMGTPVIAARSGPKIEISKNKNTSITIQPTNSPKIERRAPLNISFRSQAQNPPPPNITISVPTNRPATPTQHTPPTFNPPVVNPPPAVVQPPARVQSTPIPPQQQPTVNLSTPKPLAPVQTQPTPSENYNRLSLLSFVSAFEDTRTFNETDLASLGLDLKCSEPLLPMLHSVLSDAPLLEHSCHPTPECYTKILPTGEPQDKISLFTPQTLFFIFYTYTNNPLQILAADELTKRGYTFDEETCEWHSDPGLVWNCDTWKEQQEATHSPTVQSEE